MKHEVFISYAWSDNSPGGKEREEIVDEICNTLERSGFLIIRDKTHIQYKGSFKELEERIGNGGYIILVISDKFLKSKHCMLEVLMITKHGNIYNRVFPIVLADAKIYDDVDLLSYIDFWHDQISRLEKRIKQAKSVVHITNIQNQLTTFAEIARLFDEFAEMLQKMNTLDPEVHKGSDFSHLETAIRKQMDADNLDEEKTPTGKNNETINSNAGIVSPGTIKMRGKYVAGRDINIKK